MVKNNKYDFSTFIECVNPLLNSNTNATTNNNTNVIVRDVVFNCKKTQGFNSSFLISHLSNAFMCRRMAELHSDGDRQSGGDTVDAFGIFQKR